MADTFFTERGRDSFDELGSEAQERIKKKLGEIEDWPDHFLKPLQGRDDNLLAEAHPFRGGCKRQHIPTGGIPPLNEWEDVNQLKQSTRRHPTRRRQHRRIITAGGNTETSDSKLLCESHGLWRGRDGHADHTAGGGPAPVGGWGQVTKSRSWAGVKNKTAGRRR